MIERGIRLVGSLEVNLLIYGLLHKNNSTAKLKLNRVVRPDLFIDFTIEFVLGTIYPGLMVTSAALYHLCWLLNITIDIRNVCVFLAPLFSSFTTIITYLLTKEIRNAGAGLVAAAMVSIVPGYISRSVAGSYDNEGIAIFCMLLTYYTWIKAVKTGSIYWGTMAALAYFYMV